MAIFYFYPDEPCAIEIGLKIVPILVPSSFFARHLSRLSIINNIIITAKTIMPEIVNIAISSLIILVSVLSVAPLKHELHRARIYMVDSPVSGNEKNSSIFRAERF